VKSNAKVYVPQRKYAFADRRSNCKVVETQNVFTCTAFFGIDKVAGRAFICHFDSPASTQCLARILAEFKSIAPVLDHFETYILNGWPGFKWLRACHTRRRLKLEISKHAGFERSTIDLGFSPWNCPRSLVEVDTVTGKWERENYIWQPLNCEVRARSRKMEKADGSA
jgi:hypothetical protein